MKGDVVHEMQAIFDMPVRAQQVHQVFRRTVRSGEARNAKYNLIGQFARLRVVDDTLEAKHLTQMRSVQIVIELRTHRQIASLNPPMSM